jgi:hypothetical protein
MRVVRRRVCSQVFWGPVWLLSNTEYHRCVFFKGIKVAAPGTVLSFCVIFGEL